MLPETGQHCIVLSETLPLYLVVLGCLRKGVETYVLCGKNQLYHWQYQLMCESKCGGQTGEGSSVLCIVVNSDSLDFYIRKNHSSHTLCVCVCV